ncbi:hypothetical protein D9M72_498630 [compost metagenome]
MTAAMVQRVPKASRLVAAICASLPRKSASLLLTMTSSAGWSGETRALRISLSGVVALSVRKNPLPSRRIVSPVSPRPVRLPTISPMRASGISRIKVPILPSIDSSGMAMNAAGLPPSGA